MRLTITVNPATSFAAGYEPVDYLDLDLASLAVETRTNIAAIMHGSRITETLSAPTVEALVAAATSVAQCRERQAAAAAQRKQDQANQLVAAVALMRQRLIDRPVLMSASRTYPSGSGGGVDYTITRPDLRGITRPYVADWRLADWPQDINEALTTWERECTEASKAAETAAIAAWRSQRDAGIAARSAMTPTDAAASIGVKGDWSQLLSDDGDTVVLVGPAQHPALTAIVRAKVDADHQTHGVIFAGENPTEAHETVNYTFTDGVIEIKGSNWAAIIDDPAAPKPAYTFLDRCPGGYHCPALRPGDVLVWGSKEKGRKKKGPYDRLVYAATDKTVMAIKCDYVTARQLRKQLIK